MLGTQREQAEAELAAGSGAGACRNRTFHTRIVAPSDGVVNASSVRTGQYVSPGMRVISVVPLPNVYVVANYKETQLGKVRIGQAVSVAVDMFPGETIRGRVEQISPASGSEFALLPPDNATGNFTKVAQRIAVRIELTDVPDGLKDLLRPGVIAPSCRRSIRTSRLPPLIAEPEDLAVINVSFARQSRADLPSLTTVVAIAAVCSARSPPSSIPA